MKVCLTRAREDIERDAVLFEQAGIETISLPLIEEEPIEFELPNEKFDFVVFLSPRAARLFLSKQKLSDEKIVAVGKKTKETVESFGYKVWAMPEAYYGDQIPQLLKGQSGRVLIPRSAIGKEEVIDNLKKLGLEVFPLNVYTVKEKLYSKDEILCKLMEADALLLASPSAVRSLLVNLPKQELLKLLPQKRVICFGNTTKACFEENLTVECLTPEKPSIESVIALLRTMA